MKCVVTILVFAASMWQSASVGAQDLQTQALRCLPSVVLVQIGEVDGTGFVISHEPDIIATNAHVAMQATQPADIQVRLNESGAPLKVKAIHIHTGYDTKRTSKESHGPDVALLELEPGATALGPPLPLLASPELVDIRGMELVLIGYPTYATMTGERDTPEAAIRYGTVQRLIDYDGTTTSPLHERPLIEHFPDVVSGESGSPLIDLKSGAVVGIHVGTRRFFRKGTTEVLAAVPLAVHVDVLWEVLAQSKLPHNVSATH